MQKQDITTLLRQNAYPGRGIILGLSADGQSAVAAYFIMGRSVNSRNRVFAEQKDGIITKAYDISQMTDPSLIIYAPVRALENKLIVTNGDQTDTVYDALKSGGTFESALRTRTFEPDAPNFTPRISGLLTLENGRAAYRLSVLKSNSGNPESCQRFFFDYPEPVPGEGHFLHTYAGDGDPLPSFDGEPERVQVAGDIDMLTAALWESLNADNKVSLYVRFTNLKTGEVETRIQNKHF